MFCLTASMILMILPYCIVKPVCLVWLVLLCKCHVKLYFSIYQSLLHCIDIVSCTISYTVISTCRTFLTVGILLNVCSLTHHWMLATFHYDKRRLVSIRSLQSAMLLSGLLCKDCGNPALCIQLISWLLNMKWKLTRPETK